MNGFFILPPSTGHACASTRGAFGKSKTAEKNRKSAQNTGIYCKYYQFFRRIVSLTDNMFSFSSNWQHFVRARTYFSYCQFNCKYRQFNCKLTLKNSVGNSNQWQIICHWPPWLRHSHALNRRAVWKSRSSCTEYWKEPEIFEPVYQPEVKKRYNIKAKKVKIF